MRKTIRKIVPDPLIEIPACDHDHWIYKNPEALASLMRGIEDAKNGRIVDLDFDFSQSLNDINEQSVHG